MAAKINSGKVKFFDTQKNFGFITSNGIDYFFHVTGTLDPVTKDDKVTFELQEGKKGLKAVNVKIEV